MKLIAAILCLLALSLPVSAEAQSAAKLNVIASTTIIADMVRQVAGDNATVTSLVGANEDPHEFQGSPADVRNVNRADIIFINGLGFEIWLEKIMQNSGYKGMVVKVADGINPLIVTDAPKSLTDKGGFYRGSPRDAKGNLIDPHGWQDPANAKIYVQNVIKFLSAKDPAHAAAYSSNGAAYTQKLNALIAKTKADFARLPPERRTILVSHDALGYFGRAYNLTIHSTNIKGTENDIAPPQMAALINDVKSGKIKALFSESGESSQLLQQISAESGVPISGGLYADALNAAAPAESYVSLIEYNVQTILDGLNASAQPAKSSEDIAPIIDGDVPPPPSNM